MNPHFSPIHTLKNLGASIHFEPLSEGRAHAVFGLAVRMHVNPHGGTTALAFRVEEDGRSLVYASDAGYPDADQLPAEAVDFYRGADVLIHEVYSQAGFEKRKPLWQEYHRNMHTSSVDLARLVSKARPGLLILYHQLFWGTSEEELLEEVRAGYDGKVVSGHDLDVY